MRLIVVSVVIFISLLGFAQAKKWWEWERDWNEALAHSSFDNANAATKTRNGQMRRQNDEVEESEDMHTTGNPIAMALISDGTTTEAQKVEPAGNDAPTVTSTASTTTTTTVSPVPDCDTCKKGVDQMRTLLTNFDTDLRTTLHMICRADGATELTCKNVGAEAISAVTAGAKLYFTEANMCHLLSAACRNKTPSPCGVCKDAANDIKPPFVAFADKLFIDDKSKVGENLKNQMTEGVQKLRTATDSVCNIVCAATPP